MHYLLSFSYGPSNIVRATKLDRDPKEAAAELWARLGDPEEPCPYSNPYAVLVGLYTSLPNYPYYLVVGGVTDLHGATEGFTVEWA